MLKNIVELLKPPVDADVKLTGVSMFFGRWMEALNRRVVDLEARQLQKGDKGDKGDPGPAGKDGKDGRDGLNGKNGLNGKDGRDGVDGQDGVSVVNVEVAPDGNLVVYLSNGQEIDAGRPLESGSSGNTEYYVQHVPYQITVSATAPANPTVNQLWFDIS